MPKLALGGKNAFAFVPVFRTWNLRKMKSVQCFRFAMPLICKFYKWHAGLKSYESCCTVQAQLCRHDKKKSTAPFPPWKQAIAPNVRWTVETSTGQYCWYKIIFIKIIHLCFYYNPVWRKHFTAKDYWNIKFRFCDYTLPIHIVWATIFAKGQILLWYILKASLKVETDNGRGFLSHKTNIF